MLKPYIIFEDDSILVLDKPSGMVVNTAESVKGETVQDWIEKKFEIQKAKFKSEEESDFYKRSGIVHRIDKETSGLLLIAKKPDTFSKLQSQFKKREVKKTYISLCHGIFRAKEGVINAPVGRLPWNRERFGVFAGGRQAETGYKIIKEYEKDWEKYSLVEWYPKTGRTHQIRVHAKSLGHPIVSDVFYAGRKTARRDRVWCPRLFLHASKISFTHPVGDKNVVFESKLPQDLQDAINILA